MTGLWRGVVVLSQRGGIKRSRSQCEVATRPIGKSDTIFGGARRSIVVARVDHQRDIQRIEDCGATGTRMARRVNQEIHPIVRAEPRQLNGRAVQFEAIHLLRRTSAFQIRRAKDTRR